MHEEQSYRPSPSLFLKIAAVMRLMAHIHHSCAEPEQTCLPFNLWNLIFALKKIRL